MSASMTPELRRRMRSRPVHERFRLWRLLRKLSRLDAKYSNSFTGDAGASLSNVLNGGRTQKIADQIQTVEHEISKITVPVMKAKP